jgi:amidase
MTDPFVPGPRVRIAGKAGGALGGMTFAVKDLLDVTGVATGGGNHDWARQNAVPSRHAWAVQTLLAGARPCSRSTRAPSSWHYAGRGAAGIV